MAGNNNHGAAAAFRMFDLRGRKFPPDALRDLASAHVTSRLVAASTELPAGYTYFGQFIAHDISRFSMKPPADDPRPARLPQLPATRTPALDLDSLYGDGLDDAGSGINRRTGRFESVFSIPQIPTPLLYDLPRDGPTLAPRTPDDRNDQHFLISQLTVLFMNLHNKLLDARGEGRVEERFRAAREEVTFLYHSVIWNDYLPRVLDEDVWRLLKDDTADVEPLFQARDAERPPVPIEFSGAAFRFGHCLSRSSYPLNGSFGSVPLRTLFRLTGKGGMAGAEDARPYAVDWRLLFQMPNGGSAAIFTRAAPFSTVMNPDLAALTAAPPRYQNLAEMDLLRGLEFELPDAQQIIAHLVDRAPRYVKAVQLEALEPGLLLRHPGVGSALARADFQNATPLWTYVLMEPWFRATDRHMRLGKLGSIIVGETLRLLLRGHPVFSNGEIATRSKFLEMTRTTADKVRMPDLIEFVGVPSTRKES
jgi:hypothetical protein